MGVMTAESSVRSSRTLRATLALLGSVSETTGESHRCKKDYVAKRRIVTTNLEKNAIHNLRCNGAELR